MTTSARPCNGARLPLLLLIAVLYSACTPAPRQASTHQTTAKPPAAVQSQPTAPSESELNRVGLVLRELAPNVVLAVHTSPNASSANVLAVRTDEETVVICSSPYDTETTRVLVRALRAKFNPKRMLAINTHFHADGTHGNEAYLAEGVETYASDHTTALLNERGEQGREKMASFVETADPALAARIRATKLVPAAHIFPESEGLTLPFEGEDVQALFLGGGHSIDNVVVFFSRERILFGGCMVRSDPGLGNTKDADLTTWAETADAAAKLQPTIVVPGHGAVGGTELLSLTAERVRAAR